MTWATGLFMNNLAIDLRKSFEDALSKGFTVSEATKRALWAVREDLQLEENAPGVYLALTALQLEHNELEDWLGVIALRHLTQESVLELWAEAEIARAQLLELVLERLQRKHLEERDA